MSDIVNTEHNIDKPSKKELYLDPEYTSLYRYENPNQPYDSEREGSVSKKELIGSWYTNDLDDLKAYTIQRIKGKRGGRFVIVRIKTKDLVNYDATLIPETKGMDMEKGNYIIPKELASESRVVVDSMFKDSWEGKQNVPMKDWGEIENFMQNNLTDKVIVSKVSIID